MIDLTQYPKIASSQNSNFHIDSKLVAIHGINVFTNIKDNLTSFITANETNINLSGTWTGYVGFITINDEILYVTSATGHNLTVIRAQQGTVALNHSPNSLVYTIDIFKTISSYNWSQSIGITDRDLFSIEIDSGRIVINDLPKNWNKLYEGCLYNFKRNKEVFIWEGCNEQVTKVWEGLTKDKNDSSESNEIIIELTGYFNKFADEPIKPLKIYDNIRPKEMLEDLFKGYSAKYIGNTIITDYFKIYNLSTGDFTTYRDFINYICKEYAIHLLFRKDKTIHIISDMYPNKITPIDTIQTEITKINNDSSGNIIINSISGTYKERKALRNEKYTPVRFRKNKSFVAPALPKDITIDGVFQEISLTGLSYAEINTMTYQEYLLLEESITDRRYMCKLTDIIKIADNNYTIKILVGYDKASYWNERGRTLLQGYYLSLTNAYKLYWSYDEFPIIYKYGRNIDGEDSTSNLMFPLYPNEDYVFYIENFGVSDTSVSKFSGIVKGFETLVGNTYDNTSLFYNDEYKQNLTVPIYLYTNKISSSHPLSNDIICIGSIDNSDVTLKIEYSDIKESLYKVTIKNTLLGIPTKTITPIVTMTGQRLLKLSLADYNECEVGDALKLQEILASDPKYQTYLTFKDARYLITSKFIDDGEYYITLNDYYPMAEGTEFTFIKYIRDNIILLNELYFRANPVMEAEINYEYNHDESIIEYGTKEYTIEGKSIQKNDFLKITAYLKDTYNGVNINGIRNKIRAEMMRRVDLEAGDVIYLTDTAQTQYINQKCLITKKEVNVTTNGERDESYEMITVGNYEINPNVLLSQNILSWKPDVIPSFNHTGTEGKTTQEQNKQASNKRIVLQDSVEGQIYVDEIPQSVFYATTDLTGTITSDKQTFELGLKGLATGEYRNSLLRAGTEGVVKVNSEYLSYRSLGYNAIANTARIHIIKRGIGNTKQGDITSNIRVQFYKIIAKISAEGLKSTDVSMGDGTDNYVEIHTSTGVAIKSNKVIDISNLYNTLKFDSTDNSSYITMNNGAIKLGKNAVDGNKDGVWIKGSNDENYIKFNTTDNYVDIKCQRGRVGSATNYFDITNGLIYMNGGKQQLGAGVTDSGGTFDGFFVGDTTLSNNRYLKYNGTTFTLKTSDGYIGNATNYFDITSGKLNIGTAGKIRVASTDNVATTLFQIGETSGNYLKYDTVGGLSSSGNFNVVGGSINLTTIDTYNRIFFDATNSIIELNKNDTSTNWRFQIGKNSSSANYILFDSGNAIIKSNNINLYKDANNSLIMNSTTSSISLYQSATNKFTFDLTNGVEIITTKGKIGNTNSYFDITNKAFVLGTEGILTVGSGSNLLSWDNTNGAIFKTNKIVDIQNTNNKLYFDNTGYSYLRMNSNTQQIGRVTGLTGKVDFDGFYFGDIVLANNKHIYYDGTNFVIKGNVSVSGGSIDISNTNSTILFDTNNSVIQLNKAGVSTTSKLEINQSSDSYYFLFDKANAIIKTVGNVTISNTNNALFFETGATLNSYIRMNTNSIQLGKLANLTGTYGLTLNTTNGIFVGNTNTDLNKFMSYNGTDLQIKTDKGYIGGSLANSTYFDITNGSFQLYKSATDNLAFTTAGGLIIKSANVTVNTSSDNNYLNLTPTNSALYLGKAGTNVDVQIGALAGNHINFLNGTLDIKTAKINITDTANTSLISLNSGAEQIGTGITLSGWTAYNGIFVGDTTIANENYIKYDIGNQRFTFGDNVQIAGVIKTGDSIIVQNIGANTVVKCGEIDKINNIFGFEYTSPTNPTTEYLRLADATGGVYTQGLTLKTQGTVDISNGSGGTLNKLYFNPTANTSYLSMNGGTQQIGRVSSITGKPDYNGIFIGNTTIANNKHLYYDGTNFKIAGDVALSASSTIDSSATIGGSTVSVVVSNASNGNTAYSKFSGVGTTLPSGNVEFNFATSTSKGGNAVDTDKVNGVSSAIITTNISTALTNAATAQSTADGKITTFYQDAPPTTGMSEGDIWFDTNDGNKIYIYETTAWVNRQDSKIAQAINDASNAQGTADSKITTFYTSTQPTAISIGDLWYNTVNYEIKRWDGSIWRLVADVTANKTANNTSNVGSQTASAVQNSTINFNGRNDRNATAIVIPTINSDGTAIDHTVNTDSTSNISFEWNWAGTNADIDGFIVFIRQKSTTSSYTFGSTPSEEQVFYVTPEKRAFILYGVPVNQFYHFGIQAYRIVDADVNSSGVIKTVIVQPSLASENPYQPSASVAFAGDVSGTINNVAVATVTSNASNGNLAYTGTANLRTNTPPTNNATFGTITEVATSDGNIVVTIPYNYTQGTLKADSILIYTREGGGTVTTANVAYITKAITGSMTFTLKPSTVYRFGLQAIRTSDTGTQAFATIAQSSDFTTSAGNYTGKVDTSNVANKLYWGSDIKIGKDAYGTNKDGISITTNGYLNVANNKNRLFFDPTSNGDNSFIGLNKATTYYSAQIGKVTENSTGSILAYNGFFFGNPEENGSAEYLKYSTNNGMEFKGKYFNETAYVSTDVEFIGACNTSIETILKYDGSGNLTISSPNPFYGKVVSKINIKTYIDISNINTSHFSKAGYIVPSSTLKEITSSYNGTLHMGGVTSTLSNKKFGFYITNPIIFSNINISNMGSDLTLFGNLYGAYLDSDNIHFTNCIFSSISEKIYSAGNFNNISINDTKINLALNWKICFERIIYMTNIHISIYVDQNVTLFGTEAIFKNCKNINNIYVDSKDYSSNIYKSQIFYDCNNISNIYINYFRGIIASACKNINNVFLDHYTPYNTENRALFSGIVGLNNFRSVENITGTTQIFFNVSNVTNCSVPSLLPIHYDAFVRDKNNTWNDVVVTSSTAYTLKRDDVMLNSNQSTPVIHTLPLANLYHENRIYTIKDVAGNAFTNNITIQTQGTDKMDGNTTSFIINANYGSVSFYSDGTVWRRLISPTIFGY